MIYVIDDDPAVCESLSLLLTAEGYAVRPYSCAQTFLSEVEKNDRGCVIADVRMPGIDGLELLAVLKQKGVFMPVIVITGLADVPLAVGAMKEGAVDFLEKPFDGDVLLASIRVALERKAETAPQRAEAQSEAIQRLATLSPRERAVLEQLLDGHQNKVIAYRLGVSPKTVEVHRKSVMTKTQARSLAELVQMAVLAARNERRS